MAAVSSTTAQSTNPWQSASSSDISSSQLSGACALLALLVQSQTASQCGSKSDIEINSQKLEELKQQLADSIQKAKEASEKSGLLGFLGNVFGNDVAQVAGAVAAAAAIVASGGAAAVVLMVALSEGLQLGAKFGAELGLDPKLCMALSLASVAVGLCTGTGEAKAVSALTEGASYVELTAKVVQGGATVTGAALNYSSAHYHAKDLRYQASAGVVQANEDTTNLDLDDALDALQRSLSTGQHELESVSAMQRNDSDTNTALADRI